MGDEGYVLSHQLKCQFGSEHGLRLKYFRLNTQFTRKKGNLLQLVFDDISVSLDIIILTETWYSNDVDIPRLPTYTSFHLNRSLCHSGGAAIVAKSNLNCDLTPEYSKTMKDYVVLTLPHNVTGFCVWY